MGYISRISIVVVLVTITSSAFANCGGAFCSINTNSEIQYDSQPGLTLNLRYELVELDQPRRGNNKVGAQGEPGGHDELKTSHHNLVLGLDYMFDQRWGFGLQIPYLKREHAHIHNPDEDEIAAGEESEREEWKLSGVGDVRLIGRYQLAVDSFSIGGHTGLKLATGEHKATNAEGEEAERTLQLGTGSTDLIAGLFAKGNIGETPLRWFAQTQWQHAIAAKDNFRPGDEISVDLGLRYLFTDSLIAGVQLNTRYKRRDSGTNAEPEESGGKYAYVSPGLSYAFGNGLRVYGYVQVPMYQNVNGIQLTQSASYVAGISYRF